MHDPANQSEQRQGPVKPSFTAVTACVGMLLAAIPVAALIRFG